MANSASATTIPLETGPFAAFGIDLDGCLCDFTSQVIVAANTLWPGKMPGGIPRNNREKPMHVISPSFTLNTINGPLTHEEGVRLLRVIEWNARISHRSEDKQTQDSWRRFIEAVVLKHGDWSVVEHASVTAMFQVNRGVTHEIVRHRLFSFTQESTRFVNYEKPGFTASYIPSVAVKAEDEGEWLSDLNAANEIYSKWLKRGYAPQIARDHLPNALAATISVTGNLRNWRHFLLMRTTKETHPDCRVVTIPMLAEFKEKVPLLFDDIQPEMRQIDNLGEPR